MEETLERPSLGSGLFRACAFQLTISPQPWRKRHRLRQECRILRPRTLPIGICHLISIVSHVGYILPAPRTRGRLPGARAAMPYTTNGVRDVEEHQDGCGFWPRRPCRSLRPARRRSRYCRAGHRRAGFEQVLILRPGGRLRPPDTPLRLAAPPGSGIPRTLTPPGPGHAEASRVSRALSRH